MRATNVITLQNKLTDNPDLIEKVLVKLGCDNNYIKYNKQHKMITSRRPGGDNNLGIICYIDSLNVVGTTHNELSGNIFSLVMKLRECNFPKSLELIAHWIGVEDDSYIKPSLPFAGFYKHIIQAQEYPELILKEYQESDLPPANSLSKMFLDDGISLQVQEQFGIRLDHEKNCIIIPEKSFDGKLIGAKARNNDLNCDKDRRYWAALPFQKAQTVYGYSDNYINIQRKKIAIIFESEKAVLQTYSFGCKVGLGIGGHCFSDTQVRYIKALNVDKLIVAFDDGLDEEEIRFEANKLRSDLTFLKTKVGYIYDKNKDFLHDKMSPSDQGKKVFEKLYKNYVIWLGD